MGDLPDALASTLQVRLCAPPQFRGLGFLKKKLIIQVSKDQTLSRYGLAIVVDSLALYYHPGCGCKP